MTTTISKLSIINMALGHIGAENVTNTNLTNNDTRCAQVANTFYAYSVLKVLADHDWAFAKKRARLSTSVATPAFEFKYTYDLPSDFVRMYKVYQTYNSPIKYKIEGSQILTDETGLNIQYIAKDLSESIFEPLFAEAVSLRLAADMCYQITQNVNLTQLQENKYEAAIAKAKRKNATDSYADQVELSDFIDVRL